MSYLWIKIPLQILDQIEREKQAGIRRGWDASKSEWRKVSLIVLCQTALSMRTFTVNDFRDRIKAAGVSTHDNRAMGGLMVTAKKWGWIRESGDHIRSRVGHGGPLQIWASKIYQEPSARERIEEERAKQASMFGRPAVQ